MPRDVKGLRGVAKCDTAKRHSQSATMVTTAQAKLGPARICCGHMWIFGEGASYVRPKRGESLHMRGPKRATLPTLYASGSLHAFDVLLRPPACATQPWPQAPRMLEWQRWSIASEGKLQHT